MTDPTDPLLRRLAALSDAAALDGLEAGVFAAIDDQARSRRAGRRIGTLAVAAALGVGLAGGAVGVGLSPAEAAAPIGMNAALAPSTLLLGR